MDDKFKYKHTEVLQLIAEAYKKSIITDDERKQLKGKSILIIISLEFIVLFEPDISSTVLEYTEDKDLKKFCEEIKVLSGITPVKLKNKLFFNKVNISSRHSTCSNKKKIQDRKNDNCSSCIK